MKYKGIIFDFNGVLFWDSHLHEQAWGEFSKAKRGAPLSSDEILDHIHGKPNKHILEYLFKRPIESEELHDLSSHKENAYQQLCLDNEDDFCLSEGAVELLDYLVKKNVPRTIATASVKSNLDFFIKHLHLDRWFDLSKIVYDNGTFHSKLEMFIQAAKNLNLPPESCVVIEDSKSGIIAASQAKIGKIIALGSEENHPMLLNLPGVSETVTSLSQIKKEFLF